jgi:hypothetical protein
MVKIILRSMAAGIAGIVLALTVAMFVGVPLALLFQARTTSPGQEPEVGWDLIAMSSQYPVATKVIPAAVFVIGFLIGWRYFSRLFRRA